MIKKKQENLLQIGIFPRRLLEPPTVEKLLNEIYNVDGITRMLLQGPDLLVRILHGHGKEVDITHQDRQIIIVGNIAFELTVRVGGIYVEVESSAEENLRKVCERALNIPFEFKKGHFLKRKSTVSDCVIYRTDNSGEINLDDKRRLGLADRKVVTVDPISI
jgi:methyl-coenzyme M reductase subunit D